MKKTIFTILAVLSLAFVGTSLSPTHVYADCPDPGSSKSQVLNGVGQTQVDGKKCDESGVTHAISSIVSILSLIVGIVAIIMIIFAGFKYLTSGGEAGRVSSAKNTLLYALIGLAVAALAQVLVNFVLFQSSKVASIPEQFIMQTKKGA